MNFSLRRAIASRLREDALDILTLDESARYPYCVAQDTLTLRPESEGQRQTGQVVLQRTGGGS
jgi:hypothetical protein